MKTKKRYHFKLYFKDDNKNYYTLDIISSGYSELGAFNKIKKIVYYEVTGIDVLED